jgi:hypothetical protein
VGIDVIALTKTKLRTVTGGKGLPSSKEGEPRRSGSTFDGSTLKNSVSVLVCCDFMKK